MGPAMAPLAIRKLDSYLNTGELVTPVVRPLGEGVRSHEELLAGRSFDVLVERVGIQHAGE